MLLAGPISHTLALNAWILSKFSLFHWICLLSILLILVGVELPLFSGVEYKIVLFYFSAVKCLCLKKPYWHVKGS